MNGYITVIFLTITHLADRKYRSVIGEQLNQCVQINSCYDLTCYCELAVLHFICLLRLTKLQQ
jgi:hypothetical protein